MHKAMHKHDPHLYAVKVFKRDKMSKAEDQDVRTEVKVLQMLEHPGVVKFGDFFEDRSQFYLVLEYVSSGELLDRLSKKKTYTELEAREALKCLLSAISYVHSKGIVHRDLKPGNLLLKSPDSDSDITVVDFGFAQKIENDEALDSFCGTPSYLAPEIVTGARYGRPVDMWAVGVIAFLLLGGYAPFFADTKPKLYAKIKRRDVKFHAKYWEHVSQDAKDFILSLLCVDPASRLTADQALGHPWVRDIYIHICTYIYIYIYIFLSLSVLVF